MQLEHTVLYYLVHAQVELLKKGISLYFSFHFERFCRFIFKLLLLEGIEDAYYS